MNLLEQIIGRAIRNCSHKRLPFSQRNVELYLYGTELSNPDIEAIDLYLYRLSEFKAIKIGVVSRVLRTSAVDCLLNVQHNTQTAAQLNQVVQLNLSSRKQIDYQVGARPYSALCDYMERCEYVCRPTFSNGRPIQEQSDLYGMGDDDDDSDAAEGEGAQGRERREGDVRLDTFNEKFMSMNLDKIIHKIRDLYKESFFYKKTGRNGIIAHVNAIRQYPIAQINLALSQMVTDPNEYVNDKYGRLGRIINVGDYYLFQPIEITDKRISIHERSTPIPFKHTAIEYPLPENITEDYLGILSKSGISAPAGATGASVVPNKKVAKKVAAEVAGLASASAATDVASEVVAPEPLAPAPAPEPELSADEPETTAENTLGMLFDTFETCKTVIEKPTKEQDEWYYYCGKVIRQISQTDEFQISMDELHELVIANLIEHLTFDESIGILNHLYQKNNGSMEPSGGSASGDSAGMAIQNLSTFERMILLYYARQVIHRPLVGRRAAAASAAASVIPEDKGMLLFNKAKKELFELVVLRYETREWVSAEPEDERDFSLLLAKVQTEQIQKMNMMVGFISLFKMEYLVFKVKVMSKKRDKGARCDQSGKTDAITIINTALGLNAPTQGDEYKLTTENTKFRTQKELCVFQEFLLRTFDRKAINGKKWFFTPCEALLCDIERLHIEK
jgi:hypothetical protein